MENVLEVADDDTGDALFEKEFVRQLEKGGGFTFNQFNSIVREFPLLKQT
jgi:hypothetical protein